MKQFTRYLLGTLLLSSVVLVAIGAWNYWTVSRPVAQVSGSRIRVWAHYQHYVNASILSFDLREIGQSSMMDVFVVLLQSAEALRSQNFQKVELQHQGNVRFLLDGSYFKQLGNELNYRSPLYTITGCMSPISCGGRTFLSYLYRPDGTEAFPQSARRFVGGSGLVGMLSQMKEEADQFGSELDKFGEFHKQWYLAPSPPH